MTERSVTEHPWGGKRVGDGGSGAPGGTVPVGLGASRGTITKTPLMSSLPLTTQQLGAPRRAGEMQGSRYHQAHVTPWQTPSSLAEEEEEEEGMCPSPGIEKNRGKKKPSRSIFRALNPLKASCPHGILLKKKRGFAKPEIGLLGSAPRGGGWFGVVSVTHRSTDLGNRDVTQSQTTQRCPTAPCPQAKMCTGNTSSHSGGHRRFLQVLHISPASPRPHPRSLQEPAGTSSISGQPPSASGHDSPTR